MEKPNEGDPKAKADREKFDSIKKVATTPIITKGSKSNRVLKPSKLKSPDEQNPKWVTDPEEVIAARKAAKKALRDPKPQA